MTTVDRAIADALTAERQAQQNAGSRPEVVIVEVPKDSRLETLLCLEASRRADKDAALAAWEELKDGVAAEVQRMYPGDAAPTKAFEIPGGPMWSPLTLSWRDGKEYLPTTLIREHIPQIWDAFKQTTRGYWDFRRKGKR
jgi:hypothetical protein